jgi:hypothetical protein
MKVADQKDKSRRRVLLAIASFGDKNIGFLRGIIQTYKGMAFDLEVVVHSNAPKDLGPGIKVVVGLPSRNPWSLPFAHKSLFAKNVDRYDLFVYSEDDIGVSERNLTAFLEATAVLAPDEIAGFLRYEVNGAGTRSFPDVHASFHWKPDSVRVEGAYTTAEFTNEHAGFYLLTQDQLRRAILSGGYVRAPYSGRYGMLETAATDPFTSCGFRRVICVSHLEDFLIHHLPNKYVGQLGIPMPELEEQVRRLFEIRDGTRPASSLCEVESKLPGGAGSKSFYEIPTPDLLRLVPEGASNILSIGCGWGATEGRLKARGAGVTAMPLDSVIGAAADRLGIEVIPGTWEQCMESLAARQFDCVLMTNLLHLQPNPAKVLDECCRLVKSGGTLVVTGPNFTRLRTLIKAAIGSGANGIGQSIKDRGISVRGPQSLTPGIEKAGLKVAAVHWPGLKSTKGALGVIRENLRSVAAPSWILQARRQSPAN